MTDQHYNEFIELIDDYIIPATIHDFGAWTTEDLTKLHHLIDVELQERYHAVHGQDATIEGCPCCFGDGA